MDENVARPIAVGPEPPTFELNPNAHRIAFDQEALAVARELAAEFAREAAERDHERRLPAKELDRFSGSGLWGITVPKAYGGAGFPSQRSPRSSRSSPPPTRAWGSSRKIIWRRWTRSE